MKDEDECTEYFNKKVWDKLDLNPRNKRYISTLKLEKSFIKDHIRRLWIM